MIKHKIMEECNLTEEDINKEIDDEIAEFSGLIDSEGALTIIAKKRGVSIKEENEMDMKTFNFKAIYQTNTTKVTSKKHMNIVEVWIKSRISDMRRKLVLFNKKFNAPPSGSEISVFDARLFVLYFFSIIISVTIMVYEWMFK